MNGIERKKRDLPLRLVESTPAISSGISTDEKADVPTEPPPCVLFVADTAIDEVEIAREMQFHRAIRPEQSRAAAARALVVRELLRREIARLGLEEKIRPHDGAAAEEVWIQALLEIEIPDRVPSEEDCKRYFDQNRDRFRTPDEVHARHILLAAPGENAIQRHQMRKQAERLIAELKENPVLFADFALRHSQCPSRDQGGDLGWLQRGQTTPEFDRQLFRLEKGLAPYPIESRWGYHIVSVDDIEAGKPLQFEQVREQVSDYLELQVRQQDVQLYLLTLSERYGVRGLDEIEATAN